MKTQLLIILIILFSTEAFSQKMISFSGNVRDSQTRNLLNEINVFVTEKNTGTITNFSGAFYIFLSEGIYNVSFSGKGYKPQKITVDLRSDKVSEIELTPADTKKKAESWLKKKPSSSPEIIASKQKKHS